MRPTYSTSGKRPKECGACKSIVFGNLHSSYFINVSEAGKPLYCEGGKNRTGRHREERCSIEHIWSKEVILLLLA